MEQIGKWVGVLLLLAVLFVLVRRAFRAPRTVDPRKAMLYLAGAVVCGAITWWAIHSWPHVGDYSMFLNVFGIIIFGPLTLKCLAAAVYYNFVGEQDD